MHNQNVIKSQTIYDTSRKRKHEIQRKQKNLGKKQELLRTKLKESTTKKKS